MFDLNTTFSWFWISFESESEAHMQGDKEEKTQITVSRGNVVENVYLISILFPPEIAANILLWAR